MSIDRVAFRVPATTANMGAGFDCLGMALNVYNTYTFRKIESGLVISGCPQEYANRHHLTVKAFDYLFRKAGKKVPGLELSMEQSIPIGKGLGSSAACILAGVFAANYFLYDLYNEQTLFGAACDLEGHPDNLAPALAGGLCVSIHDEEQHRCFFQKIKIEYPPSLVALIPDFKVSTDRARKILPNEISRKDAVVNIQSLSWFFANLNNASPDKLWLGFRDRIHQPYRNQFIEDWDVLTNCLSDYTDCGWFLSGSGPTLLVWTRSTYRPSASDTILLQKLTEVLPTLKARWQIMELQVSQQGIQQL